MNIFFEINIATFMVILKNFMIFLIEKLPFQYDDNFILLESMNKKNGV